MKRIKFSTLVLVSVFFVLGIFGITQQTYGQSAQIDNVSVRPYIKNSQDILDITILGLYSGYFYYSEVNYTISGNAIQIDVILTFDEMPYSDWWYAGLSLGPLPEGEYSILVNLYANGQIEDVYNEAFSVIPTSYSGWSDKIRLTYNEVSDSFPSSLIYNELLYLFWNKSYEGTVYYMTFDGTDWIDQETIADCKTASGIGSVVYDNKVFVFYSNGTYPQYHLFCKIFDGADWSSEIQITNGDVYDAYGASVTTYNGDIYLFWKRWEPDGIRHIYYKIYNGVSWGNPIHLAGDDYIDHPVTPAVFQEKLYLFYKHGIAYQVYDGVTWSGERISSEVPVLGGSDGSSPAATVYDGELVLFLLSDDGHIYKTAFDGSIWTGEMRVTQTPEEWYTILDMTAITYNNELHLFWGGIYSWPSNELYMKYLCRYKLLGDLNSDCKVSLGDFVILANNWLIDCHVTPSNPSCVLY